ncbi:serine/threonine protein kinase, bacterial [Actinoplanes sp. SE50]|uniref:serine/threonine-protein kinase n=1 Tax=unclassified Actinoplanes TaxID=2626549 RepID=UPI00023ED263|nr:MULTISPECIES: serine/threonine-protein kinase [unclassified Actinoplanes]AEV84973.1 serine/threonine protein kinase, bacterial [Actinoplanes sp. SE50/110]ATO83364.1 serine/threonine protein kinase, bacterial [Actinoplanes sp. SE50]SLM00771.1 serine/threonine protein kinase [Actinoplanes sp. SE50/110]
MESGDLIAGRYRLERRLGQGGSAVVWRAVDELLGRGVALKVLAPALAADPDLRRQVAAEARAAARLRHVNVVGIHDCGELEDAGGRLPYVVMELVDGQSLDDMLRRGRLTWRQAVLIGAQVAAALAAAHADGIVHRDVKPANVMVTGAGVKLVDFGISAAVGALDGQDGRLMGTPAYLAPERVKGGPVRPATDVYALGLLLYLALAGQMPWEASTVTQMVKANVYAVPAPLPAVPGLPPVVARLVTRCLAKRPADRPSSAEAAHVLGEIAGLPSPALLRGAVAPTAELPVRPGRGRRGVLVAAAAGLLAAGGLWWAQDAGPVGVAPAAASTPSSATPSSVTTTGPSSRPQTVAVVRQQRVAPPVAKPAAPITVVAPAKGKPAKTKKAHKPKKK